jgi:hypothetical protein
VISFIASLISVGVAVWLCLLWGVPWWGILILWVLL